VSILFLLQRVPPKKQYKNDPSNWTYADLLKTVKKFAGENKNKCFFYWLDVSNLISGSGITFVDYKNNKTFYNSKDFIEILEIYKELYPYICTEEDIKGRSYNDLIKNKMFVMQTNDGPSPITLQCYYSMYKSIGEEPEVLPFPAFKSGYKVSDAITGNAIAINSQSINKDIAYNFVKIVLSEDIQKFENTGVYGVMPVNRKALEDDYKYAMSKKAEDLSWESCPGVPLPPKYRKISENIVSGIDTCVAEEGEISRIIKEEMPDFLEGKRTPAETAKAIDNKVNLYLNGRVFFESNPV
jgi:multiple sugar transport system substrate-binding protein